jgi:hypothetical protein
MNHSRLVAGRELVCCGGRKFHPHVAARRGKKMRKRNFTMALAPSESPLHPEVLIFAIVGLMWLVLELAEITLKKIQRFVRLCRKGWTDIKRLQRGNKPNGNF